MDKRELQYAWLAGFMDADGYFTCAVWERRPKKNGPANITIAPRIGASQMEARRNVLDYIVSLTECGKVYTKTERANNLGIESSRHCMWTAAKAEEILKVCKLILPYCVLKKKQCETMIEMVELRMSTVLPLGHRAVSRTPIKDTMKCAELALSLNPHAVSSRNSQWNAEKRTWEYWKKRIPEVYAEAEIIINSRKKQLNLILTCDICGKEFHRYRSDIKPNTKHFYCSVKCQREGEKTLKYQDRTIVQCAYCGKDIDRAKCSVRKNNWCDLRCKKRAQALAKRN